MKEPSFFHKPFYLPGNQSSGPTNSLSAPLVTAHGFWANRSPRRAIVLYRSVSERAASKVGKLEGHIFFYKVRVAAVDRAERLLRRLPMSFWGVLVPPGEAIVFDPFPERSKLRLSQVHLKPLNFSQGSALVCRPPGLLMPLPQEAHRSHYTKGLSWELFLPPRLFLCLC